MMAASSSSSSTISSSLQVPQVVKFGYDDFRNADRKSSAKCKFCVHAKVIITERVGTTSNFSAQSKVRTLSHIYFHMVIEIGIGIGMNFKGV